MIKKQKGNFDMGSSKLLCLLQENKMAAMLRKHYYPKPSPVPDIWPSSSLTQFSNNHFLKWCQIMLWLYHPPHCSTKHLAVWHSKNWHWCVSLPPCHLHHHACILYGDYEVWGSTKIWGVLVSGIGQGNGMGPQIWAIMSTWFSSFSKKKVLEWPFKPQSAVAPPLVLWVTPSLTTWISSRLASPSPDTLLLMQAILNLWNNGLHTTWCMLVLDKLFWYAINFCWYSGRWSYAKDDTIPVVLKMLDHTNDSYLLQWLNSCWPSLDTRCTSGSRWKNGL